MKKRKMLSLLLAFALFFGSFSGAASYVYADETVTSVTEIEENSVLEESEETDVFEETNVIAEETDVFEETDVTAKESGVFEETDVIAKENDVLEEIDVVSEEELLEGDEEITAWEENEAVNVLSGKTVTTSSVEAALATTNTGDKAVDGNNETRWSSERMKNAGITDADSQTAQWLTIDLQAETTRVTQLSIAFYLKVWATKYKIETAETNTEDTVWTQVYSKERASNGTDSDVVDNIDVAELSGPLKRYVRFYFEKINVNAGGTGVSVREITMMGTQEGSVGDESQGDNNIEVDPNATYHRVFNSQDTTGIELLYGSGATFTGQNSGLLLNYSSARAGIVDKSMGQCANGVFETTIVPQENGTRFGIILRATGDGQKLLIGTENSNNLWFREYWNNGVQEWSTTTSGPALTVGQEARIKVEALGNQVTLWVNETKVFTQTLPATAPMGEGYFGFDKCNSAGSYLIKDVKYTEKECAATVLYEIQNLPVIQINDTTVPLPEVKEGYRIEVVGSDKEGIITNDGKITNANIGDKEVTLLVKVTNENNEEDTARASFNVTVPSKNSLREELFQEVTSPNAKPIIIPSIQEWYGYEGNFKVNKNTKIVVNDIANVDLVAVAENMQADLKEITGLELKIVAGKAGKNSIYLESLTADEYGTGEEGYFMVTDMEGIKIYSHTYTGALYGTVTVEQILWRDDAHKYVPCGVMRDYPDYEIRGVMFDVGRMPHRLQYLEDYTKILTWYKMSEFHLHLNDDFNYNPDVALTNWDVWTGMHRLESDVFPSLTDRRVYQNNDYFNNEYADPIYTKEEYRQLEKLANSRGVDLIAEFDTPSHATAYIEYAQNNPDNIEWLGPINTTDTTLGNGFANNKQLLALNVNAQGEEGQNALNARKFIEALYEDYLGGDNPTFTSDTVHVGADEYWNSNEREAFREYINFLSDLMASYGKTARMWGAQKKFAGTTYIDPENIVLDIWNTGTEDDPIARLAEGYRVVNVPQPYLYTTPGRDHKEMVGEEYLYKNWDPVIFNGSVRAEAGEPLLLGAKAALWGDEFREGMTEADYHERMLRAVAITAEKTWGGQTEEDSYIDYQMAFEELMEGPGTEIAYDIKSKTEVVADYNLEKALKEDGKLVIKDESGNGYDAQVTGGELVTVDNKTMIEFDGTTLMTTPLKTIGYPYTISFDVKAKEGNTAEALLFSGYDGQLRAADVNGNITIKRSFFTQDSGYCIPTDKSVNVTVVGNFQNTKLYVDGELVKTFQSTEVNNERPSEGYWSTFVFPLEEIGKNFKGYIGNIKIYNKSFSQETFVNYDTLEEVNVALNEEAYAERFGNQPDLNTGNLKRHPAWKATDGDVSDVHSYWLSSNNNNDYLMVDLNRTHQVHKVKVIWNGNQYATAFKVLISEDGKTFTEVANITGNATAENVINLENAVSARFVKIQGVTRNVTYYGIKELEVYEDAELARQEQEEEPEEEPVEEREELWITGVAEEYTYTGTAIKPSVQVYDDGVLLTEKKDYTVTYKNTTTAYVYDKEDKENFKEKNAPQVIVKMKGNYSGSETIFFKIMPASLEDAVVETDKLAVVFKANKQQMPMPNVILNGKKLKANKDFEIPEYKAAKEDKTKFVDAKEHPITIQGIGNYAGKLDAKVIISDSAEVISMSKVSVKGVTKQEWCENGAEQKNFTVLYRNKPLVVDVEEDLEEGKGPEYTVIHEKNDAVGTAYLILTGTGLDGNDDGVVFKGTKTVSFKVTGKAMKNVTVIDLEKEYPYAEGAPVVPTELVKEDGSKVIVLNNGEVPMTEGEDYTVSYQKNIAKGTASVIFTGKETAGFTGTLKKTFKILSKELNAENDVVTVKGGFLNEDGKLEVAYTKGATQPKVTVVTENGTALVSGTDYTVKYGNNKKVGALATITIKGKGNYAGSIPVEFVIGETDISAKGITLIAKDKLAGKAGKWKQSFKVYDTSGKTLSSRDYTDVKYTIVEWLNESTGNWVTISEENRETLTSKDTVSANSVIQITVTGAGDYKGKDGDVTVSGTYRILEKGYDIGKAKIQLKEQPYTGEEIYITEQGQFVEEKTFLKIDNVDTPLKLGEHIEVVPGSYVKNVNKGTAKVTFKGKEGTKFGGTKTVSFKIGSKDTNGLWDVWDRIIAMWF